MSYQPITLIFPKRTIDVMDNYLKNNDEDRASFLEHTFSEYADDNTKVIAAISRRVEGKVDFDGGDETKNVGARADPRPFQRLRALCKKTHLTFNGLTRIILEDKLYALGVLQKPMNTDHFA